MSLEILKVLIFSNQGNEFSKTFYPKFILSWNIPKRLFPKTAVIIKKSATIEKRILTSFKSYGALNKGFLSIS